MNYIRLIAWKEFLHIHADPLMVRLIVFPVLAQLFIVGYALTTEVKNVPVAFVDRSNTPQSRLLVRTIEHNRIFVSKGHAGDEEELQRLLDRGEIKIGIIIPYDFAVRMQRLDKAPIQLLADGQDANSSTVATGYISAIISKWTFCELDRRLAAQGIDAASLIPVKVSPSALYNPSLQSSWYMIPALVVLLVTIITSLLTGLSIVKERERGTFEQLMVTPIQPMHVVFGKILPFVVIGLGEIAVFLILATLWFGIPFRGSAATLFLFALLYMISSLGIGIFTSTIAQTSQQVLFLTWFILIFFILLSGFFIPIENMPLWVQRVTYINPVRFFMFAEREIFLKGAGLAALWREALLLLAIGGVVFSLSIAAFQRRAA